MVGGASNEIWICRNSGACIDATFGACFSGLGMAAAAVCLRFYRRF